MQLESPKTPPIILASTSPYRRMLLKKLGLPFTTAAPCVDESPQSGESAESLAQRLAREKAEIIAQDQTRGLIIGSDQVACQNGLKIGKPLTREAAIAQLKGASNSSVEFYTALCVIDAGNGITRSALDLCRVHFRLLSEQEIERYVDRDQPWDCAGSFRSEGLGITLFTHIEGGDPNALVGLPLIRLTQILLEFGVKIP